MWSWQTAYWKLLESWGLIGPNWRISEDGAFVVGTIVGALLCIVCLVFTIVFAGEYISFDPQGNKLWRTGAWMTAIIAGLAVFAAIELVIFNAAITLVALIATYPLLTLVGLLLVGPVLMLLGKLSWSRTSRDASKADESKQSSSLNS